jgi:hypothetical protein
MIRQLLIGIFVLALLLVGVGFVLSPKAHVERSTFIEAPPSQVFAAVDTFRRFDQWSPWHDKDPQAKTTISGALFGTGAKYEWAGNKNVGTGSQEITASEPYSHVQTKLVFGGFAQPSSADFILVPLNGGTQVKWTLDADMGSSFIFRYFGLLMDHMIGPDYEKGLAKLRSLVEGGPKTDFDTLHAELIDAKPQAYAYVSGSTTTDPDTINKAFTEAYARINAFITAAGGKAAGAPIAVTRRWDDEAKVYEYDAGIPVDRADLQAPAAAPPAPAHAKHKAAEPAAPPADVKIAQTYAGAAVKVVYKGSYKRMADTYAMIGAFKTAYALQDNGNVWEEYVTDPAKTKEDDLVTNIYVPVK